MVEVVFLTVFLGLTAGVQTVAVEVNAPLAGLVFELDGGEVARLSAPPWRAAVDFGDSLLPHELVARALDRTGGEIGRARQVFNTPHGFAEADLQFEGDPQRPSAARLRWQSSTGGAPRELEAVLDSRRVPIDPDGRIALPAVEPKLPHVLHAEVRFADGVVAQRDVAFGGDVAGDARSELTGIALRLPPGAAAPGVERLAGWLERDGRAAPVVAVEAGGATVFVVRGPGVAAALQSLAPRGYLSGVGGLTRITQRAGGLEVLRFDMRLGRDDRLRFLFPVQSPATPGAGRRLFDSSREYGAKDGGLFYLLAAAADPPARGALCLADAVAVAGLQAMASGRPRAVLLVLGDAIADSSEVSATRARAYLDAVRVPLVVWRLRARTAPVWGPGEEVASLAALRRATGRLERDLRRQIVVWVDGLHAPQRLKLSARARTAGVELALGQP